LFNTQSREHHSRKDKALPPYQIVSHTFSQQAIGSFEFDFPKWANYLAFDIMGGLAFGEPFTSLKLRTITITVFESSMNVVNGPRPWVRCLWIKPYAKYIFWHRFFPQELKSVQELAQIAITLWKTEGG
jgi:benzoate 4-monooxygenase